jgi:hypothetical protein
MSSFPEVLALIVPAWCQKPLGEAARNPRASRPEGRDGAGWQVAKSSLSTITEMREHACVDCS